MVDTLYKTLGVLVRPQSWHDVLSFLIFTFDVFSTEVRVDPVNQGFNYYFLCWLCNSKSRTGACWLLESTCSTKASCHLTPHMDISKSQFPSSSNSWVNQIFSFLLFRCSRNLFTYLFHGLGMNLAAFLRADSSNFSINKLATMDETGEPIATPSESIKLSTKQEKGRSQAKLKKLDDLGNWQLCSIVQHSVLLHFLVQLVHSCARPQHQNWPWLLPVRPLLHLAFGRAHCCSWLCGVCSSCDSFQNTP